MRRTLTGALAKWHAMCALNRPMIGDGNAQDEDKVEREKALQSHCDR